MHGPQPRSYAYRLPRKVLLGALRSALSAKLAEQKLTVVDAWKLESHKAKAFREALDRLDGQTRTILLVEQEVNLNLELASRNLAGVKLVRPAALQPYDLLRHDRLMISRDAAVKLGTALAPKKEAAAVADTQDAPVTIQLAAVAAGPEAAATTTASRAIGPKTRKPAPKGKGKR